MVYQLLIKKNGLLRQVARIAANASRIPAIRMKTPVGLASHRFPQTEGTGGYQDQSSGLMDYFPMATQSAGLQELRQVLLAKAKSLPSAKVFARIAEASPRIAPNRLAKRACHVFCSSAPAQGIARSR